MFSRPPFQDTRTEPRPPLRQLPISPEECPFCQLMTGEVSHCKVLESVHWYSVMDIHPLAEKHTLLFPKCHYERWSEVPGPVLEELGILVQRVGAAVASEWNALMSQGRLAHQYVDHVHCHVIPKPSSKEGLQVLWLAETRTKEELALACSRIQEYF